MSHEGDWRAIEGWAYLNLVESTFFADFEAIDALGSDHFVVAVCKASSEFLEKRDRRDKEADEGQNEVRKVERRRRRLSDEVLG